MKTEFKDNRDIVLVVRFNVVISFEIYYFKYIYKVMSIKISTGIFGKHAQRILKHIWKNKETIFSTSSPGEARSGLVRGTHGRV